MTFKVTVNTIFNCSLERAFKTPLLCDISKVHTGFLLMPKVTHVSDDESWGQPVSSKKIYAAKSLTQKGGFISVDTIIERKENQYWKFKVHQFQSWMLGFYQFIGEWQTTEIQKDKILINYTYTLHANQFLLYPLNWLFANIFWKIYMKRVLNNVHKMACNNEPYQYP
jgi:hypothetical protein